MICSPLEIAALRKAVRPGFRADGAGHPPRRQRRQRPEARDDAAPGGRPRRHATSWSAGRSIRRPTRAPLPKPSRARPASTTYDRRRGQDLRPVDAGDGRCCRALRRALRGLRDLSEVAAPHLDRRRCGRWARACPKSVDAGRPVRRSRRCTARREAGDRRARHAAASRQRDAGACRRDQGSAPASL